MKAVPKRESIMRDRPLTFSILISLVFHLVAIAVVGATAASRLTKHVDTPQVQRMVRVELVRDPLEKPKPPAPRVEPKPKPRAVKVQEPPRPSLFARMFHTAPREEPRQGVRSTPRVTPRVSPAAHTAAPRNHVRNSTPTGRTPGDPGGKLNTGATSSGGDLPGNWHGHTPAGWVPGSDSGRGIGSGSGRGVGKPDPPVHADPGPGTRPAPVDPPPAPVVQKVTVTICRASGMVAGKHCSGTISKSFVRGSQPTSTCTSCRAPEPEHHSVVAKFTNPVLSRDSDVSTRGLEEGLNVSVTVGYTVNADGSVSGVSVIRSSGNRQADRAVTSAASGLRYKPATQNGEPCSVKMTRTYRIRT